MSPGKKELREVLRLGMKTLILQEIRLLQLERTYTPEIVIDEISRSIEDAKREIVKLTKMMGYKERAFTLRKLMQQAVDEEIDRTIKLRKNKCLRCIHGRFYDKSGTAFMNLPNTTNLVQTIGCDQLRPGIRKTCRRFSETLMTISVEDYLSEMTLFYEFREMIERMNKIWEDYFISS